jgi:hypothetical protein
MPVEFKVNTTFSGLQPKEVMPALFPGKLSADPPNATAIALTLDRARQKKPRVQGTDAGQIGALRAGGQESSAPTTQAPGAPELFPAGDGFTGERVRRLSGERGDVPG